jgi:protein-L-isoaspartate(D-aspartate) O-methyltransferase
VSEALARDLERMGIHDERVLRVMAELPRARFVPAHLGAQADGDYPLPIGFGQSISQPYMVAWMTQALELEGPERVLEVGTGSGYQAAVLSRLCARVDTVERIPELASGARAALAAVGVENVEVHVGDGALGLPVEAPFDRIIVTAAAQRVPPALLAQLRPGGRMVIPVGPAEGAQFIHLVDKDAAGRLLDRERFGVRFVPLRGAEPPVGLDSTR